MMREILRFSKQSPNQSKVFTIERYCPISYDIFMNNIHNIYSNIIQFLINININIDVNIFYYELY